MRNQLLIMFLLASQSLLGANLTVPSGASVDMHSIQDYFSLVPLEQLSEAARTDLVNTAVSRESDGVSAAGRYNLHSDFVGAGVALMSELVIFGPNEDYSFAMSELHRGSVLGITRGGGKTRSLPCPENWVDQCYLDIFGRTDTDILGNILLIRRGPAVYSVILSGLGAFEDSGEIQKFLGSKALRALEFRPDAQELNSAVAAKAGAGTAK